jgi:diguanylate cyclase (GGDEF)-like protein
VTVRGLSPRAVRVLWPALVGLLAASELLVLVRFSPPLGAVLLATTAALWGLVVRSRTAESALRHREVEAAAEGHSEAFFRDSQTGLPNRQHLIDQLTRDIARSQRYSHDLTLVVIEVARMPDLVAAWGPDIGERAVLHVAETLGRVTRNSDFLARIDDERFAVVLTQCNAGQARVFGERALLAVSNRPLKGGAGARVPVYVTIDYLGAQYDPASHRGPLDFLSTAGGDVVTSRETRRSFAQPQRKAPMDHRALRQQLIHDYYPGGKAQDFAQAYRAFRSRTG